MATFIRNALEFMLDEDLSSDEDFFIDDENAAPHEPRINAVAALGIAVGDGQDRYNPFGQVSRGQMAGFLTRTLALLEADGAITPLPVDESPDITIQDGSAEAGEDIRFTIAGEDIAR
jgi:hypothetical protein